MFESLSDITILSNLKFFCIKIGNWFKLLNCYKISRSISRGLKHQDKLSSSLFEIEIENADNIIHQVAVGALEAVAAEVSEIEIEEVEEGSEVTEEVEEEMIDEVVMGEGVTVDEMIEGEEVEASVVAVEETTGGEVTAVDEMTDMVGVVGGTEVGTPETGEEGLGLVVP